MAPARSTGRSRLPTDRYKGRKTVVRIIDPAREVVYRLNCNFQLASILLIDALRKVLSNGYEVRPSEREVSINAGHIRRRVTRLLQ